MTTLLSQTGLAKALGVSVPTISAWTADGIIAAEVSEGKVYRYDLAAVRQQLSERAKARAEKSAALYL